MNTIKTKSNKSFWKKSGTVVFLIFFIKGLIWIGMAAFAFFNLKS